jgi:hypothetical protein
MTHTLGFPYALYTDSDPYQAATSVFSPYRHAMPYVVFWLAEIHRPSVSIQSPQFADSGAGPADRPPAQHDDLQATFDRNDKEIKDCIDVPHIVVDF